MTTVPTQAEHGEAATVAPHGGVAPIETEAPKVGVSDEILKKLEALESDNKRYRDERKEARAKQQALLEEQGQYKALADERAAMIEELSAKVAELEGLRAHADAWSRHQANEEKALLERAQALSDDERADLAAISDINARRRMLDRLLAKKPIQDPPKLGAPSSAGKTNFDGLTGDQMLEAAKADPAGFAERVRSLMRGGGKTRLG